MEKVLIITYYFPPCNLTPSQRVLSWAKYFNDFGLYPVIITRKWEREVKELKDMSFPTTQAVQHLKKQNYEVYYVPFKGQTKDKLFAKHGENKYKYLRKALSFSELIGENFSNQFIAYSNIYTKAYEVAQKENIKKLLITGSPFNLFRFGYLLNKKLGVKWIADYRDAWTTSYIHSEKRNKLFKVVDKLHRRSEKKWVSSASKITSVSPELAKSINQLTKVPSETVFNGFEYDDFENLSTQKKYDQFTVTYIGTLYDKQPIELFLDAFKKLVEETGDKSIRFFCPGLDFFSSQKNRVIAHLGNLKDCFESTPRIPRKEILEIELKSHALLYVAWQGLKGIVPSKIYEYLPTGTPVIVAPTDFSVVHNIMEKSKAGISTNKVEEIYCYLKDLYDNFKEGSSVYYDPKRDNIKAFSRYEQARKIAKTIKSI